MEYFAQDEATRLDPALTVHETLQDGSPVHMVPTIRNILGGFLFSGDDVYKRAGVLSGGERTRLAVARMLLRPSNMLLLDEPTNHLDLDSKDVLLDALGRLRRHAHLRLARPLLRRAAGDEDRRDGRRAGGRVPGHLPGVPLAQGAPGGGGRASGRASARPRRRRRSRLRRARRSKPRTTRAARRPADARGARPANPAADHEARKRERAEQTRRDRELQARKSRLADLEGRIADRERAIKELEATMAAPGFYEQRETPRSRSSTAIRR